MSIFIPYLKEGIVETEMEKNEKTNEGIRKKEKEGGENCERECMGREKEERLASNNFWCNVSST
jgi:hypothetical protein